MAAASMNFRTSLRFGILAEDKTDADTIGVLIRRIATERAGASASAIGIRTRSGAGCAQLRKKASVWMQEMVVIHECGALILVHDLDRDPHNGQLRDESHLRQQLE